MTPEEQAQVNASIAFLERQCGNLAREGAQAAAMAESLAIRLKKADEELGKVIADLKKLHPEPESNVVPIVEPAA